MNKFKLSKKIIFIISVGIVVVIGCLLLMRRAMSAPSDETAFSFEYRTDAENQLAKEIIEYISRYAAVEEDDLKKIGDAGVTCYRIVLESGVSNITTEHTEAMMASIGSTLNTYINVNKEYSEEQLNTYAGEICQLIWNTILSQIEDSDISVQYKDDTVLLCNSLQKQIDELASKTTAVTISANIQKNDAELYESFAESINHQLDELEGKVNYLEEKIEDISETSGKNGTNGVNGKTGSTGKSGTDGKDGQNGVDGTDGKDGRDGTNGRTTYIAYADDASGRGFSLVPTETTKYIGTCVTTAASQPTDASKYSRWQEYRAYVITATEDEEGVTTLHIN